MVADAGSIIIDDTGIVYSAGIKDDITVVADGASIGKCGTSVVVEIV